MRSRLNRGKVSGRLEALVALCLLIVACGGGGADGGITPPPPPPPPPPATASLSGIVSDESDGARVSGAVVTVGTSSVTTQSDGQYSFANLATGPVTIRVATPAFDPLERTASLGAGSNTRNLALTRINTVYESSGFTVYIPGGISTVRGVFVFFYGGSVDARPMIRGEIDFYSDLPFPSSVVSEHRRRLMTFGRGYGFAIMGTTTPGSPLSLSADIRSVLQNVGERSGRRELALAPLLVMGHSRGGCMAFQVAVQVPEQVIGVLPLAGSGVTPCLEGSPGGGVPVYMIVGQFDTPDIRSNTSAAFNAHRAQGGLWAFGIEAGAGHDWPLSNDALFNWAAAVATRRLPDSVTPGAPVLLRPLTESSGWLADLTARVIAPFACFIGDKRDASWIPSEQNARDLQAIVSPGAVPSVITCGM